MDLVERLRTRAEADPDAVVLVVDGVGSLTCEEWEGRSNALARGLAGRGIGPGDAVALLYEATHWIDFAVGFAATQKLGAVAVPLAPGLGVMDYRRFLDDAGASGVLTMADVVEPGTPTWVAHSSDLEAAQSWDRFESPERSGTAEVLYPSQPLRRPLPLERAGAFAAELLGDPDLDATSFKFLHAFTPGTLAGQRALHLQLRQPVASGLVLDAFDAERFCRLAATGVQLVGMAPFMAHTIAYSGALERHDLSSVTQVVIVGAHASPHVLARLAGGFPNASIMSADAFARWRTPPVDFVYDRSRPGALGRALLLGAVRIVDENGGALADGEAGEIWLADGAGDATPHHGAGTGEVGYLGEDRLYVAGPGSDLIRSAGRTIASAALEVALACHPAVADAVAFADLGSQPDGGLSAAVVVTAEVQADELQTLVGPRLADDKALRHVYFLDRLPRDGFGKVSIAEVRRRLDLPVFPVTGPNADGDVEKAISAAWGRLLALGGIGRDDDFFMLGGHIAGALHMLCLLEDAYGVRLSLPGFFRSPTISGLARTIEDQRGTPDEPTAATSVAPVSFEQAGFVWREQLAPGWGNDEPSAHRLLGPLQTDALQSALAEVVRRQPILRTRFEVVDGRPTQVVSEDAAICVDRVDLSMLGEAEREAGLQAVFAQAAGRPLDMAGGSLFGATLVRLGDDDHVLVVNHHHSIWDALSAGVFNRELSAAYRVFTGGDRAPALPALPIHLTDVSRDQRRWMLTDEMERQRTYWRRQLSGAAFALQLPLDDPGLPAGTPLPAVAPVRLVLPDDLTDQLRTLARHGQATLFMTMLSAFYVLVHRYTGEEDMLVASFLANRGRSELEGVIGCFFKTLPLRMRLCDGMTFADLLAGVRDSVLEALAHQDLPNELVQEQLQREAATHGLTTAPMVYFLGQTDPDEELELEGVQSELLDTAATRANRPRAAQGTQSHEAAPPPRPWGSGLYLGTLLGLTVVERSGRVVCEADGAYHPPMVERMLRSFQTLLGNIVEDPERCISSFAVLSPEDELELSGDWAGPTVDVAGPTIHSAFEDQVDRSPDDFAIVPGKTGEEAVTYAELDAAANGLAWRLRELSVSTGTLVGVMMERSADVVVAVIGIWKAGAAFVGLDPSDDDGRITEVVRDARVDIVVTTTSLAGRIDPEVATLEIDGDGGIAPSERRPRREMSADDLACVHFNSSPVPWRSDAGLEFGHGSLLNLAAALSRAVRPPVLGRLRLHFEAVPSREPFLRQLLALLDGHRLCLPEGDLGEQDAALVALERGTVDLVDCTSEHLDSLVEAGLHKALETRPSFWPRPVLVVASTGAVGQVVWRTLKSVQGADVVHLQSLPGCGFAVTACRVSEAGWRPLGLAVANVVARVLDDRGRPVPVGAVGELNLGGPGLPRGYRCGPELSQELDFAAPGRTDEAAPLLRTGQLARLLPGGLVELWGPRADYLNMRGFLVRPASVEAALAECPGVSDAVVMVGEDAEGEASLIAYVVAAGPAAPTLARLRSFLWSRLPGYVWPAALVVLPGLPLTAGGELDVAALPRPETEPGTGDFGPDSPDGSEGSLLASLWAGARGTDRVSSTAGYLLSFPFLDAVTGARQAGLGLPAQPVVRCRTIAMLATAAAALRTGSSGGQDYLRAGHGVRRAANPDVAAAVTGGDPKIVSDDLDYWRERLAGAPPVLELPADHARPSQGCSGQSDHPLEFPVELALGLEELGRAHRTTTVTPILAAFAVLLCRYTGSDDILIGSRSGSEGRSGGTPLVLRIDLSGDPTFVQALARLALTVQEANAHAGLTFDRLIAELAPDPDPTRHPIVQVAFGTDQIEPPEDGRRFDLEIRVTTDPGGVLGGKVIYSSELFEPATIGRFCQHLIALTGAAVARPDGPISELEMLSPVERRQLLVGWNDTETAYRDQSTVVDLFRSQVVTRPATRAVVCDDSALSYAELDARANRLAHHLQARAVGPEVVVGLCLERGIDMVVAVLGVMKAGGAYLPLDHHSPRDRLKFMLEDAEVAVVLTQHSLVERLPESRAEVVCLDRDAAEIAGRSEQSPPRPPQPDDLAYVIYTSGSTGQPKGVEVTHRSLVNFVEAMTDWPGLGPGDVMLAVTTLSFDVAGVDIHLPLASGATVVVASSETASDPYMLMSLLEASGATAMPATPATWRMLLDAGWTGQAGLKALSAGEALSERLADQLLACGVELWNMYGPTEATIYATGCRIERGEPVTIGRPMANTRVYILDEKLRPVPVGVPGELHIGGVGLARGYLNRPELTAQRFIADPFAAASGERLYNSGDLARWRPDGLVEFLGRLDHQVKVRGFRIELGEIESTLAAHPAVQAAVVTAREDTPGHRQLVAYLVVDPATGGPAGGPITDIRSHASAALPHYMVPSLFVPLAELPLTPSGKIDRRALPAPPDTRSETAEVPASPRTETEAVVAAIWADVLRVGTIGRNDDFFDLGGDSLLATRLVAGVRQALSVEIPVRTIFENPTVAGLAGAVDRAQPGSGALR